MSKEREENKKAINLMPEDQRSKESGFLAKSKSNNAFDFDLVSPKDSSLKKIDTQQKKSILNKLKSIFNKPLGFGQSTVKSKKASDDGERPKIIYNPQNIKKEDIEPVTVTMHIPDKSIQNNKDSLKIDYSENILEDLHKKEATHHKGFNKGFGNTEKEVVKAENKPKGPSLWERLKKLFAKKPKLPKAPKMERVPERPIVARELNTVNNEVNQVIKKENEPIDILEETNIPAIPELKVEKPTLPEQTPVEQTQSSEVDFSIPSIPEIANEKSRFNATINKIEDKDESKDKQDKQFAQEFHQPQSRIRAKLLENGGGVDLIPAAAKTRSWKQIINLLLISSISSIVVVALFYGFLFYQGRNIEEQRSNKYTQITTLEEQIIDYKNLNDNITLLGDQIKSIHKLLSFHIYWTNFFQLLEKYTIEDVYYANITAGNGGALTLEATAANFEALARQIKILEQESAQEFVTSVDVASAEYNEITGVTFSMTLVLNKSLFVYNENYIYEMIDNYSNQGAGQE